MKKKSAIFDEVSRDVMLREQQSAVIREQLFEELQMKIDPISRSDKKLTVWIWHGIKFVRHNQPGEPFCGRVYDTSIELTTTEGNRTYASINNKFVLHLILSHLKKMRK